MRLVIDCGFPFKKTRHKLQPTRKRPLLQAQVFCHGCGVSTSLLFHDHITRHKRGAWRVNLVHGGGRERAGWQARHDRGKTPLSCPTPPHILLASPVPSYSPCISQPIQSHASCYVTVHRPALRVYSGKTSRVLLQSFSFIWLWEKMWKTGMGACWRFKNQDVMKRIGSGRSKRLCQKTKRRIES